MWHKMLHNYGMLNILHVLLRIFFFLHEGWRKYPLRSIQSQGTEQFRDSVKSEKKEALSLGEGSVSFVSIFSARVQLIII